MWSESGDSHMIMMSMHQEYWSKLPYYFHHGALQSMDENTLKGFV